MITDWLSSPVFSYSNIISTLTLSLLTLVLYQSVAWLQQKWQFIWLNPMLFTIVFLIPLLLYQEVDYQSYRQATQFLHALLEPATVALGFPLYQQIKTIRRHWQQLILLLSLGIIIVVSLSFTLSMLIVNQIEVAIALSLKSVTAPIGIALTEQLSGDSSITPFAIMIAGFSGAFMGPKWLRFINVHSTIATGLSIGAASHVIGSIVLTRKDPIMGAYSSVALILSAVLTAFIMPILTPLFISFLS